VSADTVLDSIRMLDPENLVETFGISTLSSIEAEILLLPVWLPPSWIVQHRLTSYQLVISFLQSADTKVIKRICELSPVSAVRSGFCELPRGQ
jgi:hypothetical protein